MVKEPDRKITFSEITLYSLLVQSCSMFGNEWWSSLLKRIHRLLPNNKHLGTILITLLWEITCCCCSTKNIFQSFKFVLYFKNYFSLNISFQGLVFTFISQKRCWRNQGFVCRITLYPEKVWKHWYMMLK